MKKQSLIFFLVFFILACHRSEQNRILKDEHVVEFLKKNGDKLIAPREVFHWIYFKTDKDAENFKKEAEKKYFIFVSKSKVEENYPFLLGLKRVDKVDIKSVNEYSLYLLDLAEKHNGDYDGWETNVVK